MFATKGGRRNAHTWPTRRYLEGTPGQLLRARRGDLALTYTLTLLENLFELLYPWAIGFAINGLLVGNYMSLGALAGIWMAHIVSGLCRQRFDTRLFSMIYAGVASHTAITQRAGGASTSDVAARTDMAEEFVEFAEHQMPATVLTLFGLLGGMGMLYLYDFHAALIMSVLIVPAALIFGVFGRRAFALHRRFNDQSECEVRHIQAGRARPLRRHFVALAKWRVRVSDAEAGSWTSMELITLIAVMATLIRFTSIEAMAAGSIFAAIAYVLRIIDALDEIPEVVSQLSRLIDGLRRLRAPGTTVSEHSD